MEIRHPVEDMSDIDKIIRAIGELKSEELDILPMEKGESISGVGSVAAQVHVRTKAYSLALYFTQKTLRIAEYPYEYIPVTYFNINDVNNVEILGNTVTFHISNGNTYGLKTNSFTLDFDNLLNSTEELLNKQAIQDHPYRS